MKREKAEGKVGQVSEAQISEVMRELGRRGGLKKVKKGVGVLSKAERSKRMRAVAKARWAKVGRKSAKP